MSQEKRSGEVRVGGYLFSRGCCIFFLLVFLVIIGAVAYGVFAYSTNGWPFGEQVVVQPPLAQTQAPIEPTIPPTLAQPVESEGVTVTEVTGGEPVTSEPPAGPDIYAGLPVVTAALDAFAPYDVILLAKAMALDAKWGVNFNFITFYSSDETSFDESTRSEMLSTGQWDMLFTTQDKLALRPTIGQMIAFVDETDGADKLICNDSVPGKNLNALKGKRIAYFAESIGEFAVYYYLNIPGILPTEVALVPNYDGVATYDNNGNIVGGAVYDFNLGKVECVSGWEPDVDDALNHGGHVVISTSDIRIALDTTIISNQANQNRPDEIQASFNAFSDALKFLLDQPEKADQILFDWLVLNQLDGDNWSFIYEKGDLLSWLKTTPQATLADNVFVFRNVNEIAKRLAESCRIWKSAGFATPDCKPETYLPLINPKYVQHAATIGDLATTSNPVNDSFLFTSQVDIPKISLEDLASSDLLATLPFDKIGFLPNDFRLTEDAKVLLDTEVCPKMQASPSLVLKLTGSSALPPDSPTQKYTLQGSNDFSLKRANEVKKYLTLPVSESGGGCFLDSDRILTDKVAPQNPRATNIALLEADRFVKFELFLLGY